MPGRVRAPQRTRAEPRTRPVGRAAVPGRTDDGDVGPPLVELLGLGEQRPVPERRRAHVVVRLELRAHPGRESVVGHGATLGPPGIRIVSPVTDDRSTQSALEIAARPVLDAVGAARLADDLFGATGPVRELGSQQDRNFRVDTVDGARVLKVANRAWGRAAIEAQNAALLARRRRRRSPRPSPLPALDGSAAARGRRRGRDPPGTAPHLRRGITALGRRIISRPPWSPTSAGSRRAPLPRSPTSSTPASTGSGSGTCDERPTWSRACSRRSPDPERRARARRGRTSDAQARARPRSAAVAAGAGDPRRRHRRQRRGRAGRGRPGAPVGRDRLRRPRPQLAGRRPRRHLLVASCATGRTIRSPCSQAVRAFHEVVPLDDARRRRAVAARRAARRQLVVAGEHQACSTPTTRRPTEPLEAEWRIFDAGAVGAVRPRGGRGPTPRSAWVVRRGSPLPSARSPSAGRAAARTSTTSTVVDLSVTSDALHSRPLPRARRRARDPAGRGRATARPRPAGARRDSPALDLAQRRRAGDRRARCRPRGPPWHPSRRTLGRRRRGGRTATRPACSRRPRAACCSSESAGLAPAVGSAVAAGGAARLGRRRLAARAALRSTPRPVRRSSRPVAARRLGWRSARDPSALLGVDVAAPRSTSTACSSGATDALARVQEHYYDEPMRIERGWRHHLVDTDGRAYVDMVNNVAAVGHGHPRLADAVDRQMRAAQHQLPLPLRGDRASSPSGSPALAPDGLDTVFLVNSGSEAVDLALRIAQAVTGRQDVVAVREAYHGWTYLSDAVTTSLYDNPRALETRPGLGAPRLRARTRSAAGSAARTPVPRTPSELRELVERIASRGSAAGGVHLRAGARQRRRRHAARGLPRRRLRRGARRSAACASPTRCRWATAGTGHHWWAYEMHGVHARTSSRSPRRWATATRSARSSPAARSPTPSRRRGRSSPRPGAARCRASSASTVLDIIEDERLQAERRRRRRPPDRAAARRCMERHPIIGAVHGMGLYLGVELVRDRETLEPATAECYADLRPAARARRRRPAHRRAGQRAQDEAADVPDAARRPTSTSTSSNGCSSRAGDAATARDRAAAEPH